MKKWTLKEKRRKIRRRIEKVRKEGEEEEGGGAGQDKEKEEQEREEALQLAMQNGTCRLSHKY